MSNSYEAKFCRIEKDAKLPTVATQQSVGYDLYALENTVLYPEKMKKVRTGLVCIPPLGYYYELYPRSSLSKNFVGVVLANSVGLIDPDYIGPTDELCIVLLNTNQWTTYKIEKHQKIAQLVLREKLPLAPIKEVTLEEVSQNKSRGGFGHSGKF